MFNFLMKLLFDQVGEYQPTAAGTAAPAPATEKAPAPDADTSLAPDGQGEDTPPPAPKYGEFGDDPDRVWAEFNKLKPQLDQYKGKITATERNLSALRRTLDSSGIQIVSDESGNIKLLPKEAEARKRRFTDEHKGLFDDKVLNAIQYMIQDALDDGLDGYSKKNSEATIRQRQFIAAKNESNEIMIGYFPQLKVGSEGFNEALYNRATEIWESEEAPDGQKYKNKPEGELLAALKAARELNVSASAITEAKKAGYEQGKAEKKILAPVSSSSSGKAASAFKLLEKGDYLKLKPEERLNYDKQLLDKRNKGA
jgi:hypothetical protein